MAFKTAFLSAGLTLATVFAAPAFAQDAEAIKRGKQVYRQCMTCHVVKPGQNRIGPNLYNVMCRKAGSLDGFNYSPAHKAYGVVWTPETLDPYLKDPRTTIPGNRMAYAGLKNDQQRADLIAYLASDEVSPDFPEDGQCAAAESDGM